jgi:hypothetical protein
VTADNWKGSTQTGTNVKATARWTEGLTMMSSEQSAEEAYATVLDKAGCSLRRDAVDLRIINDVRNGVVRNGSTVTSSTVTGSVKPEKGDWSKGGLIDTPSDVGGYPTLNGGTLPTDTDRDAMPDEWELAHGLDPNSSADSKLNTLDENFTNLEVYLNSLVQDLF